MTTNCTLSSRHDASQPKSANDLSDLYKINVQNKVYSNDFHENDAVGMQFSSLTCVMHFFKYF